MIRKSLLLSCFFGGLVIIGAILLMAIVAFGELQTRTFVYLGFGLMIFGGGMTAIVSWKQDEIDKSQSFTGVMQ